MYETEKEKAIALENAEKNRAEMEQMLLNSDLYMISVNEDGLPYLVNGTRVLLYTDYETGERDVLRLSKLYDEGKLTLFKVQDNSAFFDELWDYTITQFVLNGDSELYSIGEIFRKTETAEHSSASEKAITTRLVPYNSVIQSLYRRQPKRRNYTLSSKVIKIRKLDWYADNISLLCAVAAFFTLFFSPLFILFIVCGLIAGLISVFSGNSDSPKSGFIINLLFIIKVLLVISQ